ncbi:MAG: tetratricopeptide repeat protein [Bacteroidetes bacterium]|nr:tetratricopeptide repeat protein [Bacteroidota bacterium]
MHTRKGDFLQSMKFLRRSLQLSEAYGDSKLQAEALWAIGIEHDFQRKYDDAIEYLQRCLDLRQELGDLRNAAMTLEIMGAICTNKGDYQGAIGYLERCRELAGVIGDKYLLALNLHGFARNYRDMGALKTAIAWMKQAMCAYGEINDHEDKEFMARSIGDLYSRDGNRDSAIVYLDSAMVLAQGTRQFIRMGAVHEVMSDHFARVGEYQLALEHYRAFRIVEDSMFSQRSIEQINELTVRYETEKKDQQIGLLGKDKRIADLELLRRAEELERQRLLGMQREQKMEMLAQQREIQDLTLARQKDELALSRSDLALNRAENARKQQTLDLQASLLSRETLLRNAAITGLFLVVLLAMFIVRGLRDKRRAAALRASSAEYQAQAAAAQAESSRAQADAAEAREQAVRAESERKAREIQEAFAWQLITSQEQERKRIAGSLHDGIGQDLLIIKHRAMMALEEGNGDGTHIKDILEVSTEAIDDVRRISRDLRPYQLERVGLTATLRSMLSVVEESTELEIAAEISDIDGLIAPDREIDLYRVVQEAFNNIIKHAVAKKVHVNIGRMNGSILLSVRDDGRGFDTATVPAADGSGLGLQGMAERVRMLGGNLSIESEIGVGTTIQASVPVEGNVMAGGTETSMEHA